MVLRSAGRTVSDSEDDIVLVRGRNDNGDDTRDREDGEDEEDDGTEEGDEKLDIIGIHGRGKYAGIGKNRSGFSYCVQYEGFPDEKDFRWDYDYNLISMGYGSLVALYNKANCTASTEERVGNGERGGGKYVTREPTENEVRNQYVSMKQKEYQNASKGGEKAGFEKIAAWWVASEYVTPG